MDVLFIIFQLNFHNCQIKLNFMPLSYYLFPATAKQKGLRMAYTKELGPVPIANENQLELHKFYQGHATF